MSKSLVQIFKDKGIKTQVQKTAFFKANDIVVLKSNNSHSYGPAGSTVTWRNNGTYHTSSGLSYLGNDKNSSGNYIPFSCLTVKGYAELSVKGLEEESKKINAEQKALTQRKTDVKVKLKFLKEAGVDSFTDNEYKAYMTLKTIDKKDLSDVEKAQAIAKLIEG